MADQDPLKIIESLYGNQPWGTAGGGAGSGFADRDYWLAHPSEILNGRLQSDLLGTGPDQPEGTPGTGVWQQSGKDRQGILTPSGMPQSFWDFKGNWPKGATAPTNAPPGQHWDPNLASYQPDAGAGQSDIVDSSIANLSPNRDVGAPMPRAQQPANPNDQVIGDYQDQLRQQILDQMKGGI
jgi:hypothetical protein